MRLGRTRGVEDADAFVLAEVVYRERDRELVQAVPLESLLVESDGPWAYRGEFEVPEAFFDPLPEEELSAFEGAAVALDPLPRTAARGGRPARRG